MVSVRELKKELRSKVESDFGFSATWQHVIADFKLTC